jgi:hypothetical protein
MELKARLAALSFRTSAFLFQLVALAACLGFDLLKPIVEHFTLGFTVQLSQALAQEKVGLGVVRGQCHGAP